MKLGISTFMIATAILGINNAAQAQCRGDWCPIPNAYFDQNAPARYGYNANSAPQQTPNPNWQGNPYWQGNQNPNWQGNQTPDFRNDTGWRTNGSGYTSYNDQSSNSNYQTNSRYSSNSNNPSSNSNYQTNSKYSSNYNTPSANSNYSSNSNSNNSAQGSYALSENGQGMYVSNLSENQSSSDTLLQQKVDDTLKNNYLRKNYKQVNARVYNGNVTLTGTVESDQDRLDAEKRVRDIKGVRQVNDQLRVDSSTIGYNDEMASNRNADLASNTSDADLQQKVDDTLKNNYVRKNFDSVTATVNNGVVTLTGTVDSDKDRQEISQRLQKIKGISNINDRLQVTSGKMDKSYSKSNDGSYTKTNESSSY